MYTNYKCNDCQVKVSFTMKCPKELACPCCPKGILKLDAHNVKENKVKEKQ